VVAPTTRQWRSLVKVLGRPELADHPNLATVSARIANRDEVLEILRAIVATNTAEHWVCELESADVPVSFVSDMRGVFANPQIIHRGIEYDGRAPRFREADLVRNPIRFSSTPIEQYSAPPLLGEHTAEVLRERLGLTEQELGGLAAREVL
jgi:crotonobetainyl-CoA:carnitine CoA-transferase CaiB-like acyl-CoA transferase